jgi:hypothetical protein
MAVYTKIETKTATIANAGTTSAAVDLGAAAVCGIEMPATITGVALTIHGCSTSGGTYGVLRTVGGVALAVTVAASGKYYIDPTITQGWPYIKVVMDAQSQSTAITLLCRPV